jgi:asparagine N-glycosylation enzyme membrane subunit Stt3
MSNNNKSPQLIDRIKSLVSKTAQSEAGKAIGKEATMGAIGFGTGTGVGASLNLIAWLATPYSWVVFAALVLLIIVLGLCVKLLITNIQLKNCPNTKQ